MDRSGIQFARLVVDQRGQVAVARLLDRRPCADEVAEIGGDFRRLVASGVTSIVIDFGAVEFFNADLRAQLVKLCRVLPPRSGLAVCSLNEDMREQLLRVGFQQIMTIAPTVEEAVEALNGERRSGDA